METFVADIHAGRWDLVLGQVSSLQLPREKLVCLYEQVVIELLEAREVELAREVAHRTASGSNLMCGVCAASPHHGADASDENRPAR
jgi:hypothetical protein